MEDLSPIIYEFDGFRLDETETSFFRRGTCRFARTVKDLVAGAGISFTEYGKKSFPETQGEWRLFNVQI